MRQIRIMRQSGIVLQRHCVQRTHKNLVVNPKPKPSANQKLEDAKRRMPQGKEGNEESKRESTPKSAVTASSDREDLTGRAADKATSPKHTMSTFIVSSL